MTLATALYLGSVTGSLATDRYSLTTICQGTG
jgi:hypothetical protein